MALDDLQTFVHVAEQGSLTAAAELLGVPKSTVSRRVARLEAELDVALLRRSPRSVSLTEHGRALAARTAPALRELMDATAAVADTEARPTGDLVVSAAIDFAQSDCLTRLIARFRELHPEVRVHVQATNRKVDIYEERVDIAFRLHGGPLDDSDTIIARRLTRLGAGLYARTALDDLAAVRAAGTIHHGSLDAPLPLGDGSFARPVASSSNYAGVAALAAAGTGVAALPHFVAQPWVARGELTRVVPEVEVEVATLSILWLRSRHLAPRVRAFVDLASTWW